MRTVYNAQRQRLEVYMPGPDGQDRLVAIYTLPGTDTSDVPPGVFRGETDDQVLRMVGGGAQPGAAPATGGTVIGDSAVRIAERARQANTATALRSSQNEVAQAEERIRREMQAAGVDPGRFFVQPQASSNVQTQGTRAGGYGRPSLEMEQANADEAAAAIRMDTLTRAERLQQIENAWENQKIGLGRLEKMQGYQQALDEGGKNLALQQQELSKNPANDKFTQVIDPTTGNPRGVHASLAGAYQQQFQAQQERDRFLQATDPAGYQAEQRARLAPQKEQLAPHVRASWFDEDTGSPEFQRYAQGYNNPRFAGGGMVDVQRPNTTQQVQQQALNLDPNLGVRATQHWDPNSQAVQQRSALQGQQKQGTFTYEVGQAEAELAQRRQLFDQRMAQERQSLALQGQQVDQQYQQAAMRLRERQARVVAANPYAQTYFGGGT